MQRKHFICATEDGDKVVFERLYGLLGNIAAMVVRRYQLERHLVVLGDGFQLCGAFIVKDVKLGKNARRVEAVN